MESSNSTHMGELWYFDFHSDQTFFVTRENGKYVLRHMNVYYGVAFQATVISHSRQQKSLEKFQNCVA